MQLNFKDLFPELPGTSRIWIYSSDRPFSISELPIVRRALDSFVARWAAHGKKLSAQGDILLDRFVVLAVDESIARASGCSIDSTVHFLKDLCKELNVDLFNRMNVYILKEEQIIRVHLSDLRLYRDALLFDPMITDLDDFRKNFLISVEQSLLFKQFV